MLSNNYISPASPKLRALRTYMDGTHSHNQTFHLDDYDEYEIDIHILRDIARDRKTELMRSHLAESELIFVELIEEHEHINLNVWPTELGERVIQLVNSGYVWDCHAQEVNLTATHKFYEEALRQSYISDNIYDHMSQLSDPLFRPYVVQFMRRRIAA